MEDSIKVYVVMCGCIDDEHIDKIYSSLEKVKERVNKINSTHWGRTTEPYIDEWKVDDDPEE